MLLLIVAALGIGFFAGSNGSLPRMVLFSVGVVILAAVMAVASDTSILGVVGFVFAAAAAFQAAFVMTAIFQESALSRATRQPSSQAVRN